RGAIEGIREMAVAGKRAPAQVAPRPPLREKVHGRELVKTDLPYAPCAGQKRMRGRGALLRDGDPCWRRRPSKPRRGGCPRAPGPRGLFSPCPLAHGATRPIAQRKRRM